jgi:hypothetical protein
VRAERDALLAGTDGSLHLQRLTTERDALVEENRARKIKILALEKTIQGMKGVPYQALVGPRPPSLVGEEVDEHAEPTSETVWDSLTKNAVNPVSSKQSRSLIRPPRIDESVSHSQASSIGADSTSTLNPATTTDGACSEIEPLGDSTQAMEPRVPDMTERFRQQQQRSRSTRAKGKAAKGKDKEVDVGVAKSAGTTKRKRAKTIMPTSSQDATQQHGGRSTAHPHVSLYLTTASEGSNQAEEPLDAEADSEERPATRVRYAMALSFSFTQS